MHTNRRDFCALALSTLAAASTLARASARNVLDPAALVAGTDRDRILKAANSYLTQPPITVTASSSPRSPGGPHDFFSEGDYWWPDPKNPKGTYIRRDGETNPANFVAHRDAMRRLSLHVPALVAAFLLTKDARYGAHAVKHLEAWFVTPATRMTPDLELAQIIQPAKTGRGTGIIDTVHLVEVARAAQFLHGTSVISAAQYAAMQKWFAEYLTWLTTSKNGIDERNAKNNHGSCWVLQAAAFAAFTGNTEITAFCRERFKTSIVPDQIARDGSLPLELARTKPYSYSTFCLDINADICQLLTTQEDNLWNFKGPNGAGMQEAIAFLYPYLKDKSKWPFAHDVEYFDDLPVRQPNLLFGGIAYNKPEYIDLWKTLNPDPKVEEIIRNFPVRQPLLWVQSPKS